MILRNSSGDIMRWAPDQCDTIVERLQQARDWHGPIVSTTQLRAGWFGQSLTKSHRFTTDQQQMQGTLDNCPHWADTGVNETKGAQQ